MTPRTHNPDICEIYQRKSHDEVLAVFVFQISCMIYVVWVTSAIIAVTPFVAAQDPEFDKR